MNRVEAFEELIKSEYIHELWYSRSYIAVHNDFVNGYRLDGADYKHCIIDFEGYSGIFVTIAFNLRIKDGTFRLILPQEGLDWFTVKNYI